MTNVLKEQLVNLPISNKANSNTFLPLAVRGARPSLKRATKNKEAANEEYITPPPRPPII